MVSFHRKRNAAAAPSDTSTVVPSANNSIDASISPPIGGGSLTSKMPALTLKTFFMAILVAMGGFIFGYDTGQISGFLEMDVFKQRFGELGSPAAHPPDGYYFSNVRQGLIVAMVSLSLYSQSTNN
jgi:SP family sugar:H+ symporter-like MFS transporter